MTPAGHHPLLTDAERQSLNGLWLTAARPVEGLYAGRHRSPLKGHSTEFHDYRPYSPGDAPRTVDWKLYGRTDRLYVRRFRHDAELAVHLMIDCSASMDFDGLQHTDNKWLAACRLAAAIAHLTIAQQDRVSLTLLGEKTPPAMPLGGGWNHWQQLCETLRATRPYGLGHTPPLCAHQRGIIVLISDLMDDPAAWLNVIGRWTAQRHDVAAFQILHRDELDLPLDASWKATDSETGQTVLTAGLTKQAYAVRMREHVERLRSALAAHGVDHQVMRSDQSPIAALARYVSARTGPDAGAS